MSSPENPAARFRSATEFPKTVDHLDQTQVHQLYAEMRECLIFTNRSRAQLIRRNEEHKQTTLQLKTDVSRLQNLITQLRLEKQTLAIENQQVVAALEEELTSLSGHLDNLATAFDGVADIETMHQQAHWSFLAMPNRFFTFLRAVKAIVLWWRQEKTGDSQVTGGNAPSLSAAKPDPNAVQQDRRDNPQLYSDPASQGKSLLDR